MCGPAAAKVLVIPDFPSGFDPQGFQVNPIPPGERGSNNLREAPNLTYGVESPDGMQNTLQMRWDPVDSQQPSQAGWELAFGQDPDLTWHTLSLSIFPPGWVDAAGNFVGIFSSEIQIRGPAPGRPLIASYGFNTDQLVPPPPVNDPGMVGLVSLQNNAMNTVQILFDPNGVAGRATVWNPLSPGGVIAPNFSTGGSLNFTNAMTIEYYENGNLRGLTGIPGLTGPAGTGLVNWWDHASLTPPIPEPITLVLLPIGAMAVLRRRRRRA